MMDCCQNPIGFKQLVFAVAQDCKKWWKMVSNSKRLFSHCFRKTKNQQLEFLLSCCFSMWTSQGLNLGPPDYESVKIKFFKVS